MNGGKVGDHYAKCFGAIHAAENLAAHSLQFIGNVIGQRKHKRRVDRLKWDSQPRAVLERNQLRLSCLGLEIHDDVLGQGVLVADFQDGKKLSEKGFGEFGIDGEPDLSALFSGSNDSALRADCCLLRRGHVATVL
ncbi:MAG: hypothetical protein ABR905_17845 [Terracidiphilus sp.]